MRPIDVRWQVDLNLFKVQREEPDPVSSMGASVLHALNTDVRTAPLCAFSSFPFLSFALLCTHWHSLERSVSGFICNAGHFQRQRVCARGRISRGERGMQRASFVISVR